MYNEMKSALTVLYNKSPQNLYEAMVNKQTDGNDRVKTVLRLTYER